jgi:hypothetical protein
MYALTVLAVDHVTPPAGGELTELAMWSALVGWATPPVVAVINQPRWPSIARLVMTLVFSVGVAAATCALDGRLTAGRWVTSALTVATVAVVTYRAAWHRTATQIERTILSGAPKVPPAHAP